MSLALKITPLPSDAATGKYDNVTLQHGGLRSVQRQWEVGGGSAQSAEWLNDVAKSLFDEYGTKDGETTNTSFRKRPDSQKYVFPNCYLEEQGVKSKDPKSSSAILTKTYQEAYSTFRDIQKPIISKDENDRDTVQRTMVILNGSPAIDDPIGTVDDEFSTQVYTSQVKEVGNAVTIVKREFTQATNSLQQVGGDVVGIPINGLRRVTQTFIGLLSASTGVINVGTNTISSGGKTLYLADVLETPTAATKTVVKTWVEAGILSVRTPKIGGQQTVQVSVLKMTGAQVASALSEVTSSHKLINESVSDFEGAEATQFTYEVDDFDVFSQTESGFDTLDRTQLSASTITNGVVGTDTYSSLYLASEQIDNGGSIKIRKSKWSARGVISVRPIDGEEFSLAPSYAYTTLGLPASSMTGLTKPDGTALGSGVTWLEPSVQNIEGFPTYSQEVMTISFSGSDTKVDTYEKFFTITDPGVMSTGGAYNSARKSGAATRYPQALSQPQTYRKKATVDVYLTASSIISDAEVAYTEEGVNWCSIAFDSFYTNDKASTASVSSSWRSFPQMLNSSGTTDTAWASAHDYNAYANSYGAGDIAYTTSGIYRVELVKYQRKLDATQLYLRTVITFA
jgi:hypothetical protein